MKKFAICFSIFSLLLSACSIVEGVVPSKKYVSKRVNVEQFNGISTSTSIDVIYTQTSGSRDVEIYASDNIVPLITVNVENGILKVRMKNKTRITNLGGHKMEVRVSAPAVNYLSSSSSGDIILKNGLNSNEDVTLKASSSGDIKGGDIHCKTLKGTASSSGDILLGNVKCVNLIVDSSSSGDFKLISVECDEVKARVSSAGDIKLAGSCNTAYYDASSSGDIKAKALKAKVVEANASSAGDVECYASQSIKVRKSSAGGVSFSGSPAHVDIR